MTSLAAVIGVLIAAGAVAVAALAGTDRLLALAMARLVARRIAGVGGTGSAPAVRFGRGAFLPQLVSGRYRLADVTLRGFRLGQYEFSGLTARLSGVRAPLRRMLDGGVTADQVTATVMIPMAALSQRLPAGVALQASGDALRISGTVLLVPVTGTLSVSAEPRRIVLTPRVTGIPAPLGFVIEVPGLPRGLMIDSAHVRQEGLEVHMTGTDVCLRPR